MGILGTTSSAEWGIIGTTVIAADDRVRRAAFFVGAKGLV
jgi:hypothetical protein